MTQHSSETTSGEPSILGLLIYRPYRITESSPTPSSKWSTLRRETWSFNNQQNCVSVISFTCRDTQGKHVFAAGLLVNRAVHSAPCTCQMVDNYMEKPAIALPRSSLLHTTHATLKSIFPSNSDFDGCLQNGLPHTALYCANLSWVHSKYEMCWVGGSFPQTTYSLNTFKCKCLKWCQTQSEYYLMYCLHSCRGNKTELENIAGLCFSFVIRSAIFEENYVFAGDFT